ncbi:SET domain-containing protein [Pseudooceanicola sp.]|uniref:SET domain-containing protein n=1 Tax=Pseudooceanicola sp. TaxID=1914328 RepID=UPI003512C22E
MMTVRCYLAPSSIEGLGIFCRDPIAKGQVIWQSDPLLDMRIPIDQLGQYPEHVREFIERYAYVDVKNPAMLVLESDEGRFMNHSDRPNTDFTALDYGYSLVDIPAGVEITCDYREIGENLVMQPPRHAVHQPVALAV